MKKLIISLTALAIAIFTSAESVDEIRANKAYLSGTGYGETLELARNAALAEILSKISINVKSDFMSNETEVQKNGQLSADSRYEMVIRSYSSATLNNVKSLVVKPEPDAEVVMWIPIAEIDRIFEGRLTKAKEFVRVGNEALEQNQIDDALRYYYWAYKLAQSLRRPNEATLRIDGEERGMLAWLNAKIESVMAGVSMSIGRRIDDNTYELNAKWQGRPVRTMGYTYFDGVDNTMASMRDGRGLIEMRPNMETKTVQVKLEFEFRGIAQALDSEVYETLESRGVSRFAHAYTTLPLPGSAPEPAAPVKPAQSTSASADLASSSTSASLSTSDVNGYEAKLIQPIIQAIEANNLASVKSLFTPEGYNEFSKIMGYGKVRLLPESELRYFPGQDGVVACRGLAVNCRFQGRRSFTEQLSFAIGKDGKVQHVSMGVGNQLAEDIALGHSDWSEESRKRLVDFIEDYRTAYAMKDADYLERVFDDNAVIIVGRRNAEVASRLNESQWQMNNRVTLTRYSKDEFIKHLRQSFASKEYINLVFSNSRIIKPRPDREIYSIEVKQDYYSSNYGDSGYLTLVMDLTDPANPVIHVRTWQENPDPQFGIVSIFDF